MKTANRDAARPPEPQPHPANHLITLLTATIIVVPTHGTVLMTSEEQGTKKPMAEQS